jgi:hypothetical protein
MLALAYPDVLEGLLISRATDASLDPLGRIYCVCLLGELSKSGRQAAAGTILALAQSPDCAVSSCALWKLSETDLQGEHRRLYLSQCREETGVAFDAVALWNDPATVQEMERIVAASPGIDDPEYELRFSALEVLDQLRILESPDWNVHVERILARPGDSRDRFDWAVKVGEVEGASHGHRGSTAPPGSD